MNKPNKPINCQDGNEVCTSSIGFSVDGVTNNGVGVSSIRVSVDVAKGAGVIVVVGDGNMVAVEVAIVGIMIIPSSRLHKS